NPARRRRHRRGDLRVAWPRLSRGAGDFATRLPRGASTADVVGAGFRDHPTADRHHQRVSRSAGTPRRRDGRCPMTDIAPRDVDILAPPERAGWLRQGLLRGRGLIGVALVAIVVLAGVFAPLLAPYAPLEQIDGAHLV